MPVTMTELQRVLRDIDNHPDTTVDDIAERVGLGTFVVQLLVSELEGDHIVGQDDDGIAVSWYGREIMSARTAEPESSSDQSS